MEKVEIAARPKDAGRRLEGAPERHCPMREGVVLVHLACWYGRGGLAGTNCRLVQNRTAHRALGPQKNRALG